MLTSEKTHELADGGEVKVTKKEMSGRSFTTADGADALAHVLSELMTDIGTPPGLRSFGCEESDIDTLVQGTMKQTRQLAVVPRPVSRGSLTQIFTESL